MKLGVYVGSFDPVHIGHKHIIDYLLNNNYLDKVIIIPTGNYWNKNNLTNLNHRINMLKSYENTQIIIDNKYNNFEYTHEVLEELKKDYPNDILYLIIGADNLINFHLWKKVEKILKIKILVLPRNNINTSIYINNFKEKDNFITVDNFKEIDISSTLIRNKLNKKEYEELTKYLDKDILTYIIENKLYEGDRND